MKKKIFPVICLILVGCILPILYCPISSGQQHMLYVQLWGFDKDGYFIYNVTNLGNDVLENATFNVTIDGGGKFYSLFVETSFFVEELDGHEFDLYNLPLQKHAHKQSCRA